MEAAISRDGTHIAYARSGSGPALVLVHGTTEDHARWAAFVQRLEPRFTTYALDRRGRGQSGDGPEYALEREFEDVAAVVDAVGSPAFLLGHSFGAVCALEATLRTANVAKLVLYEPPVQMPLAEGVLAELTSLVDAGRNEAALITFLGKIAQLKPLEIELLRRRQTWQDRVATAPTVLREVTFNRRYVVDPERFGSMRVPTLLLLGAESPTAYGAAIERIHSALPSSRIELLPRQRHVAMDSAPQLFLDRLLAFLLGEAGQHDPAEA
jgi:pimeloyl-ACP methyl ester carboxylesterase